MSADPSDPHGGKAYDPADFFVSPSDAKGASYRVTFRLMPDMDKAMEQIIDSKRFPFKSRGEILRWALREGIRILDSLEQVTTVTQQIDIISDLMASHMAHDAFLNVFELIDAEVKNYMSAQAPEQAVLVVAQAKHRMEKMPEGYWKDRYLEEHHKRYGTMLGSVKGIHIIHTKP